MAAGDLAALIDADSPNHFWKMCGASSAGLIGDSGYGTYRYLEELDDDSFGFVQTPNAFCDEDCNMGYFEPGEKLKSDASDCTVTTYLNTWALEFYIRVPVGQATGTVLVLADNYPVPDDVYISYEVTGGANDTIEVGMAYEVTPGVRAGMDVMSGTVPADGCIHQVVWKADMTDSLSAELYLDGANVAFNSVTYWDYSGGCAYPAYLRFGNVDGVAVDIELNYLAQYVGGVSDAGAPTSGGIEERWAAINGCCGCPPLVSLGMLRSRVC